MQEKTKHYTNSSGRDLIDEWIDNDDPIEVRAKIISNIQRYARRYGKKDDILKESIKIANYADRLVKYEKSLKIESSEVDEFCNRFLNEV